MPGTLRGVPGSTPSGVVVPYDPAWPQRFAAYAEPLQAALQPWLTTAVQHIGSTAVPGMPAKPVIDMMAGVAALSDADAAQPVLTSLGYERRPHRIDAVLFVTADHGVHLTVPGSELWSERLAFRDALRGDPHLVAEYAELKRQLLAQTGGKLYDAAGKRAFVRRVLAGAGVTLQDGRHDPVTNRPPEAG